MFFDVRPLCSAIARNVNSASRAAAQLSIRMHLQLPHSSKQHARIVRIHRKTGAAYVLPRKKHPFPVLATVYRAKNAALLLRTGRASKRACKYNIGIRGMNDDPPNAAGLL